MYFRFLAAKKLFTKSSSEFKKLLKEFWFTLYSRGNRILGSRLGKKTRKFDQIPEKNLAVGLNMCSLVRRSLVKSRCVPMKRCQLKRSSKKSQ